jgi:hypothetical protein
MRETTPLAPSVARLNVVEGTYGLELRRRWYVSITEVTRISTIGVINVQFLYLCEKNRITKQDSTQNKHSTHSKNQSDTGVRREDDEM